MNTMHQANRRYWDRATDWWEQLEEEGGLWHRCPTEPHLAFDGGALGLIREVAGDMSGRDVCVVGSGDNHAAFAFAGMGANVTSVDISDRRLAVASRRAEHMGLPITFIQADAADSRFWQDYSHLPGTDDSLLDWKRNPRAALPVWLALASQKPFR